MVLGQRLWHELFGGSPEALGAPLRLDDEVYTVAGVVGPELRRLPPAGEVDLWLPFPPRAEPHRTSGYALARLAPGVSAESAEERIVAVERQRAGDEEVAAWRPEVIRPADFFAQFLGRQLLVIQVAVGLMLLIGCANVGNLFLVRAAGRRQELAVRGALGAGRGRIVRTLMMEALLVAVAGAALGLLLAVWGGRVLTGLRDWTFIDLDGLRLDPALFAFTAGAALLATLAFGLVPALTASRSDLGDTLRAASPGGGSGGGSRARSLLAVAEVALSLVLLVGAGLVTKRFVDLLATGTGFRTEGLVAVSAELPESRYGTPESQAAFLAGLREGLDDLERSGVEAALASGAPTEGGITFGVLRAEGAPEPPASTPPDNLTFVEAGSGYFRTAGIPILEGRALGGGDVALAGVLLGTAGALAAARLLGHLLGDVSPHDPVVYALAAAVLLAACAGAVLIPATRAARLDPVRVLRRE